MASCRTILLKLILVGLFYESAMTKPARGPRPAPGSRCRRNRRGGNVMRIRKGSLIDLSHVYDADAAYWPSHDEGFRLINFFTGITEGPLSFFYSTNTFSTPEHAGTHMDAPSHFAEDGHAVDEVNLYDLFGPGVLVDLTSNGERFGKDQLVTVEHFGEWEGRHGRIQRGSIVLVRTGYGEIYYDRPLYLGTNMTGPESVPQLHFPGFHPDAAQWLVDERGVSAIGIDTPSMDYGQSQDFLTHRVLAERNIPTFENVANLQLLDDGQCKFDIIALPMKIKDGSGAATRIVAVLK